jgi:class 3 adenylate cyclase
MDDIIKESQFRIKKSLDKGFTYHHFAIARSDKFLRKHDSQRLPMFVVYVDLVGSTKMSSELDPEIFNTIIRIFSQEMAYVIEHFDGYVLKFVGDAVLGYFLASEKVALVANKTIMCAKTMQLVIKNAINPLL